jgi:hypothetical protein
MIVANAWATGHFRKRSSEVRFWQFNNLPPSGEVFHYPFGMLFGKAFHRSGDSDA